MDWHVTSASPGSGGGGGGDKPGVPHGPNKTLAAWAVLRGQGAGGRSQGLSSLGIRGGLSGV